MTKSPAQRLLPLVVMAGITQIAGAAPPAKAEVPRDVTFTKDVASILLTPVSVTKDNVKSTVVADGFWTRDQICTADYAAACQQAGI